MFCTNCGMQMPDDSRFCQNCGAQFDSVNAAPAPQQPVYQQNAYQQDAYQQSAYQQNAYQQGYYPQQDQAYGAPVTYAQPKPSFFSNKKNVAILGGVAAVVIVAIVALIVIGAMPTTYVLDDYLIIEYEGLSTMGDAYLDFDYERFKFDVSENEELFGDALDNYCEQILNSDIDVYLDKDTELTNGDEINLVFENNAEEALKDMGVKLVLNNTVIVVDGLQEPIYLDVFEDLVFTYTKCAPYTYVDFECVTENAFIEDYVYFYLEGGYDLSEGSTFTVHADFWEGNAHDHGYIIKENTKTITVTADVLPQPIEINPFDYVTVTFDGLEGEGYADFDVDYEANDILYSLRFSFNKDYDLSAGEVITLSYTNPYNDDPLYYGCTLATTTAQQYTVPTLDSYITSFKSLPESAQTVLLTKANELAKYYLTKESNPNGTLEVKLSGTEFTKGNELSHAQSTGNVNLHSIIAGSVAGWWSNTNYLIFVYSFDITGHPNVTENDGNVTDAYAYLYITNPMLNGDGTLDMDIETDIVCNSQCYMSYEALEEAFLEDVDNQDVYTVG